MSARCSGKKRTTTSWVRVCVLVPKSTANKSPSALGIAVCSVSRRAVEEGLTYRFHAAWAFVLEVLRAFFEACGQHCHSVMRKVIKKKELLLCSGPVSLLPSNETTCASGPWIFEDGCLVIYRLLSGRGTGGCVIVE